MEQLLATMVSYVDTAMVGALGAAATAAVSVNAAGMPWVAAGSIFSAILRCMGNNRAPLLFNTLANVLNIILNFFLIYEKRTVPLWGLTLVIPGAGRGVAGAALSSALSWVFAGTALLWVGTRQGRFRIHLRTASGPTAPSSAWRYGWACPRPWSGPPSTWGRSP